MTTMIIKEKAIEKFLTRVDSFILTDKEKKKREAMRQIHLLESPIVEQHITQYPIDVDNVVGKPKYQDSKVYINDTHYFDNVPQVAWEFYIGGYQPAKKWLKDRKERKLEFDDILHYLKIIVVLSETDRLIKDIDKIEI